MSKDTLQELLMGAAIVVLGYALWKHFKAGQGAAPAGILPGEFNPNQQAAKPFSFADLISGTTNENAALASWSYHGQDYLSALTPTISGVAPQSVVKTGGGYW
jgi:hypothetical protein